MSAGRWTLEAYVAKDGTVPFDRFLGKLSGGKLAVLDAALTHVLAVRGMDLARTEWRRRISRTSSTVNRFALELADMRLTFDG